MNKFITGVSLLFCFTIQISCKGPFSGTSQAGQGDETLAASSKKPNIIFLMVDDLGWGELNTYGNTFNETPNLNKLASQGMQFTQAYAAAPVCSPTRASVMTGQYPARVGITDFLAPKSKVYLKPEDYLTINEALSQAGYHTGLIGKWHLDTHFKENKGSPKNHGFDEVIGTETKYIADGDYFYPFDKVQTLGGEKGDFLTDRLMREAVNYIDRNKDKDQPFFLYFTPFSVHTSLDAPPALVNKYKEKFDKKYGKGQAHKLFDDQKRGRHRANHVDNPYLAAMLERIDEGVGKIMKKLEESGIADNTLFVFFSDNGGAHNVANNGYLRGHKLMLYEGGIREPLIIRWPGKVKKGTTSNVPVSSIDFYPTFLDVAGADKPSNQILDGVSILPLITQGKAPQRDALFWHYPSETAHAKDRMGSVIRKGDFKLIQFYEDGRLELYDLKNDPGEKTDLSSKMPGKVRELKELLDNWKSETKAMIPLQNE